MLEKIEALKSVINGLSATNKDEVEALRIKYLSKKGEISLLFNDFRNVPNEQKKEIGQKLNELKNLATDKINTLRESVEAGQSEAMSIDLTRPAAPDETHGRPHLPAVGFYLAADRDFQDRRPLHWSCSR